MTSRVPEGITLRRVEQDYEVVKDDQVIGKVRQWNRGAWFAWRAGGERIGQTFATRRDAIERLAGVKPTPGWRKAIASQDRARRKIVADMRAKHPEHYARQDRVMSEKVPSGANFLRRREVEIGMAVVSFTGARGTVLKQEAWGTGQGWRTKVRWENGRESWVETTPLYRPEDYNPDWKNQ